MEVHHHPDVERKKFREYFLEFVMIFLAVSLGFFAESLRERLSDREHERDYVTALNKDLVADTLNIRAWMQAFNTRIGDYDTLIGMLRNPTEIRDGADLYYRARITTRGTVFEDNNNTMLLLSTAGNFRLISHKEVAAQIIRYQTDIDNYKNVNGYDAYEARALYAPQARLFDAFVFNDMSRPITDSTVSSGNTLLGGFRNVFSKPAGNPKLLSADRQAINEFVYYLHQRRSTFAAEILILYKQMKDAGELIQTLRREYHLKDQ